MTCAAAGGTARFNFSVADIVPYPVYFCEVANGNQLNDVWSAYRNSYGMTLISCYGVADATRPRQSSGCVAGRAPSVLAWTLLFFSLAWLASCSL